MLRAIQWILLGFLLSACTEVVDLYAEGGSMASHADSVNQNGDVSNTQSNAQASEELCSPDPCVLLHRECVEGECLACVPPYTEDGFGACIPQGDPCSPDPCIEMHKVCVGGFCGECLEGFIDDGSTNCMAPSPCFPNPCKQPGKSVCFISPEGLPECTCNAGAHDDGQGNCTFDPCDPNPCAEPFTACSHLGPYVECGCPAGELKSLISCIDDPCIPNPCQGYAQTDCLLNLENEITCECIQGFVETETGCVEDAIHNPTTPAVPVGDIDIDHSRQIFVDDWLIQQRTGLLRRLHPTVRVDPEWLLDPDVEAGIGRTQANGSLLYISDESRQALPSNHPLKPYPWRLYYMGYRQLYEPDSEPAWLCLGVAHDPEGPWVKPVLDADEVAPHCIFRKDGLLNAEVSFSKGVYIMSAMRLALGNVEHAGIYLYESQDGYTWKELADGEAVVRTSHSVVEPAAYPRIGERSRITWDTHRQRFFGIFSLPSPSLGDARGVMFGGYLASMGWKLEPDAVDVPGILGPDALDLSAGRVYGDMVAWREGSLWLGLVQKRAIACPKKVDVSLVTSRDGRNWVFVSDEDDANNNVFIGYTDLAGEPDTTIDTLSGGAPAEADGLWHFFTGGVSEDPCTEAAAPGGIVRFVVRAGAPVGLEVKTGSQAALMTRPMKMATGLVSSTLEINAWLGATLTIQVEALSEADTILLVNEVQLQAGDHQDTVLSLPPLNDLTSGRFRLRFSFSGDGELFGFRFSDPLCTPNPCQDSEKSLCDSSSGTVECLCTPPLHDDGLGGCTDDPCVPDPCTAPHEVGCTVVMEGVTACDCEQGWVRYEQVCIPDPCIAQGPEPVCPLPGPDRCRVTDGQAECYCPEGSTAGAIGCYETDLRAFVTSLALGGDNINGIAGADIVCNNLAAAAGLPGEFGPWLSTPEDSAKSRFQGGGPWRTWDPEVSLWTQLVAWDVADLTDGNIVAPINRTEFGLEVQDKCLTWTGTTISGQVAPPEQTLFGSCLSWTSTEAPGFGLIGLCHATDGDWTEWAPAHCSKELHLYCLELGEPQSQSEQDIEGNKDEDP